MDKQVENVSELTENYLAQWFLQGWGAYIGESSWDFLLFPEEFSFKIHTKYFFKTEKSLRISNIFLQSQTELQVIYSHENKLPNWRET